MLVVPTKREVDLGREVCFVFLGTLRLTGIVRTRVFIIEVIFLYNTDWERSVRDAQKRNALS